METELKTQNSKRNKEFQILILAEAAILKKNRHKKADSIGNNNVTTLVSD